MKKTITTAILVLALGGLACKSGGEGEASGKGVEVSADMKAFIGGITGTSDSVESALKTHGAEGLNSADMEMYDLAAAKVVKADGACYTMEAKAGMTVRTYDICWEGGKIKTVTDKGMR